MVLAVFFINAAKIVNRAEYVNAKKKLEDKMSETLTANERNELEELREYKRKAAQKGNAIKVSAKGAVSIYGLGRFPVTLYKSQWAKLIGQIDEIKAFLVAHDSELAIKE